MNVKKIMYYTAVIILGYVVTTAIRHFFGTLVAWITLPIGMAIVWFITYKIWPFIEKEGAE